MFTGYQSRPLSLARSCCVIVPLLLALVGSVVVADTSQFVAGQAGESAEQHPTRTLGDQETDLILCSSRTDFTCHHYYKRHTDRLGHLSPLYAGEAACSYQYMFGVTKDGVFQWQDCSTNETKVFYKAPSPKVYFVMKTDASWNVHDANTDELLWKEECSHPVYFYPKCLSMLDCPYIHLRKSGHIILNSIDPDGSWVEDRAPKVYRNLWE